MIMIMIIIIIITFLTIIIFNDQHDDQMSWYDRAKGRRKFRVNEEDEGLIQVLHITFYGYDDDGDDGVDDDDVDDGDDDDDDDDGVDDDDDDGNSNFRSS